MMITSRALVAVLAVGAFAGCSGDDAATTSTDGEGTTSADDSTSSDPSGDSTSDPTTQGGTESGPTSSTSAEGSTSAAGSSSGSATEADTSGSDTGSTGGDTDESSSSGSELTAGSSSSSTGPGAESFCGDGFIDDGEECDTGEFNANSSSCTAACTLNVCGDGFRDTLTEGCDDGNDDPTDDCVSCQAATCGDGFTHLGVEECDDADGDDLDACHNDCSTHDVIQLALGSNFTCALFDSGNMKCWGSGATGRLGYGNTNNIGDDETPADVGFLDLGGASVESVTAGGSYTCVTLDDGTARCFGAGAYGQLGYGNMIAIGDNEAITSVNPINFGGTVAHLGAGGGANHSCAVLGSGTVKCWGQSTNGKLGIVGQTTSVGDNESLSSSPATDVGGAVLELVTGQSHTCAMMATGTVRCWGSGANGALGYGNASTIGDDETPASAGDVPLSDLVTDLAVGWLHSCAILEGGAVQCWGRGNDGRLGYGSSAYVGVGQTPAAAGTVSIDGIAREIDAGFAHTCAMLESGEVQCWGFGAFGQLGYGNTDSIGDDELPSDAGTLPLDVGVRSIAADGYHTCAIMQTGSVRCWGNGGDGRLGYGNTDNLGDDESLETLTDVPLFPTSE